VQGFKVTAEPVRRKGSAEETGRQRERSREAEGDHRRRQWRRRRQLGENGAGKRKAATGDDGVDSVVWSAVIQPRNRA
jgi:hypothetical protein